MFSEKESKQFISWYKEKYPDGIDTIISKNEEKEHIKERKTFLSALLKKPNRVYKMRSRGKETVLEKAFNSLRLNYGPKIDIDFRS